MKTIGLISALAITLSMGAQASDNQIKSIYGEDNRVEALDYHDAKIVEMAKSVAGALHYKALTPADRNGDFFTYDKFILEDEINSCTGQAYNKQYMLMGCSGFLIGPKTLLTAGHCVMDQDDCDNLRWVFDYYQGTELIAKENIFKCANIIKTKMKTTNNKIYDYAIIELDRETNRAPLKYRTRRFVKKNTKLTVIGHPMGLPMKIADKGKVAAATKNDVSNGFMHFLGVFGRSLYTFYATLDSFEGNSGSPVINTKKGIVEGILIEGNEDYEISDFNGDGSYFCRKLVKTKDSIWHASERVQRITAIKEIQ